MHQEVERKNVNYLRQIFSNFGSAVFIQCHFLFGQWLASGLSLNYLNAFSLLIFVGLFFDIASFALGQSCMIVIGHDLRISRIRNNFSGALGVYILFSLLVTVLILVFSQNVLNILGLSTLPDSKMLLFIWLALTFLNGLCYLNFFFLSSIDNNKMLFISNVSPLVTNIIIVVLMGPLFTSEKSKFLFYSLAYAVSLGVGVAVSCLTLKKFFMISLARIKSFLVESKKYLVNELTMQAWTFPLPFIITLLVERTLDSDSVAGYSLSFRILDVWANMFFAVSIFATSLLIELKSFRGEREWFSGLRTIRNMSLLLNGLPYILLIISCSFLFSSFFNLNSEHAIIVGIATILGGVPSVLTLGIRSKIRLDGKMSQRTIGILVFDYLVGMPALYYLAKVFGPYGAAIGLVLPHILDNSFLYFYNMRLGLDKKPSL